jgi:hypothetical protein
VAERTFAVAASADDAYQTGSTVTLTDTAAILADPNQYLGLRFQTLGIPQGATIISAVVDLVINDTSKNDAQGTWYGQDADDAATFTTGSNDISSRASTTATVAWTTNDLGSAGATCTSPDLSTIIQEVVDRPGWTSGNDLVLIYQHTDTTDNFQVSTFDHATHNAPQLRVEWGPVDVAGLVGWWDASDTSTITGTNPVTAWADKSGGGNTFVAGTGPVSGTRTQAGLNVLDFNGTTQYLTNSQTLSQPWTVCAVVENDDGADGNAQVFWGSLTEGTIVQFGKAAAGGANAFPQIHAGSNVNASTTADLNAHYVTGIFDNTSSVVRRDGTSVGSGTVGTNNIGTGMNVGRRSSSTPLYWDGAIAELLIYNSALGTTDRQTVEAYLNTKWMTQDATVNATALTRSFALNAAGVGAQARPSTLARAASFASASFTATASPDTLTSAATLGAPALGSAPTPPVLAATSTLNGPGVSAGADTEILEALTDFTLDVAVGAGVGPASLLATSFFEDPLISIGAQVEAAVLNAVATLGVVGAGGLVLDGTGDFASTPDSSAWTASGFYEVAVRVELPDYSGASEQHLIGPFTTGGNQRAWQLALTTTGLLRLRVSGDGIANTVSVTGNPALTDGVGFWLGFAYHTASGVWALYRHAYQETRPILWDNWTTVATGLAAATVPFDSTGPLTLGSNGVSQNVTGTIFAAEVFVDGVRIASPNFSPTGNPPAVAGAATYTDAEDNIWTLAGNAAIVDLDPPRVGAGVGAVVLAVPTQIATPEVPTGDGAIVIAQLLAGAWTISGAASISAGVTATALDIAGVLNTAGIGAGVGAVLFTATTTLAAPTVSAGVGTATLVAVSTLPAPGVGTEINPSTCVLSVVLDTPELGGGAGPEPLAAAAALFGPSLGAEITATELAARLDALAPGLGGEVGVELLEALAEFGEVEVIVGAAGHAELPFVSAAFTIRAR